MATIERAANRRIAAELPRPRRSPIQDSAAITEAAAQPIDELVRQIRRTLQFTEAQRRHLQPAAIWLMGGGASMRNVGRYLAQALELPVHIWKLPRRRSRLPVRRAPVGGVRRRGGPFGSGLEGSMRTMINLLPASYRRQQIVRKRAIQWMLGRVRGLAVGLGLALVRAARGSGACRSSLNRWSASMHRRKPCSSSWSTCGSNWTSCSSRKRWPRNWNTSAMR